MSLILPPVAADVTMHVDTDKRPLEDTDKRPLEPGEPTRGGAGIGVEADRLEAVQVRRARVRGLSWAEIATQLGVSRQAVHRRYRESRTRR